MSDTNSPSPRNKALDLLSRREHSVAELRAKLITRDFDPDAIEAAIETLIQEDLVSDDRFAGAFVISRTRKGQGPIRIRGELRQREVADELIDRHLEQTDVDWFRLARSVRDRKYGADEPIVDGVNNDQLFFVAQAQTWCMKSTPKIERMLITVDSHSPARFRVVGPAASLPQFAEVFGCADGTPMNPAERCEVW